MKMDKTCRWFSNATYASKSYVTYNYINSLILMEFECNSLISCTCTLAVAFSVYINRVLNSSISTIERKKNKIM